MFTSPVPLVEFYSQLLPAARRAGYKVVLTALAREADSPPFYADVKRYWTSVDDLTGPQVLFVFAGANAAEELDKHGLQSDEDSVICYAANMAMRGENAWRMKWDHSRDRYSPLGFFEDHLYRRYWGRFRPHWRQPTNLPKNHTSELFELKQFMGIHERQLPCLVFTFFSPDSHATGSGQRIIVPFSVFAHGTTYLFLKHLMELCEPHFQLIDAVEEEKTHLLRRKEKLEWRRSVFGALAGVQSEVGGLSAPAVKTAVEEIVSLTQKAGRTEKDRAECFSRLTTIRHTVETQHGLVSELRRLIDLSFSGQKLATTSEDSRTATPRYTPQGIQTRLDELDQQIRAAWDGVARAISETEHDSCTLAIKWDFFIAYAKPDEWWAERLYDGLGRTAKPFLDKYCLLPGDRWTDAIREAHNRSSCTILVITNNTPKSWYAESEYLHAINMARTRKHRIVPIFCGEPSEVPYGLEQLHALSMKKCSDIDSVSGKLVEALHQVPAAS